MPHFPRLRIPAILCLCALPQWARAQDVRGLDRLPEGTLCAASMPDLDGFAQRLSRETGINAQPEKWLEAVPAYRELAAKAKAAGLTGEELAALFGHDAGLAVVGLPDSQPMLVLWSGCGAPLADKGKAALMTLSDKREKEGKKTTRTELGSGITEILEPQTSGDKTAHADTALAFIASHGGRLVLAMPMDQLRTPSALKSVRASGAKWMAAFMAEQTEPGVFATRLRASCASIRQRLDTQDALVLAAVDIPEILRFSSDNIAPKNSDQAQKIARAVHGLGFDGVEGAAMTLGSEKNGLVFRLDLASRAPRRGLPHLLDQPQSPPEIPAWIPPGTHSYARVNFDLAQAFDITVASAKEAADAEGCQKIDSALMMANGFFGMQVPGLNIRGALASVGSSHHFMSDGKTDRVMWPQADAQLWPKIMAAILKNPDLNAKPSTGKDGTGIEFSTNMKTASETHAEPGIHTKIEVSISPESKPDTHTLLLGKHGLTLSVVNMNAPQREAPRERSLEAGRALMPARTAWIHAFWDESASPTLEVSLLGASDPEEDPKTESMDRNLKKFFPDGEAFQTLVRNFGAGAAQGWTDDEGFHYAYFQAVKPAVAK